MAEANCNGPREPAPVRAKVERERRRLQQASAVLACLIVAADEKIEVDLADVALVARRLVDEAVIGLDAVSLNREGGGDHE